MYVDEIVLINFRNYEGLNLKFNRNINFITGKNGQGKTNIVESIYMMSLAKSFRASKDSQMIRFNQDSLYIQGTYYRNNSPKKVEISIGKDRKGIKLNGVSLDKRSDILGQFYVVIFSPEDLKLVKSGPSERRKFLDREISQMKPRYFTALYEYNKTLSSRNKYLKNFNIDKNLLDIYDIKLAQLGTYIIGMRREYVKILSKIAGNLHEKISQSKEKLSLVYSTNVSSDLKSIDNLEEHYYKELVRYRDRDIERKVTNIGIHKDDIEIYLNGIDIRYYGSQGQQRTASISLKLSEIDLINKEIGEYPVLILDDVFSELDENRQRLLIETLKDVQIFITSAEEQKNIFDTSRLTVFTVDDGRVQITNGGN